MIMGGHRYKGSLATDQWPWCGKCAQNFLQVIFSAIRKHCHCTSATKNRQPLASFTSNLNFLCFLFWQYLALHRVSGTIVVPYQMVLADLVQTECHFLDGLWHQATTILFRNATHHCNGHHSEERQLETTLLYLAPSHIGTCS